MTSRDLAKQAAYAAGKILRRRVSSSFHVGTKTSAVDLVTEVDEAAEAAVRQILEAGMPGVPILGEEQGGAFEAATRWIVDPLDGTVNFVHGFPWYSVSIALEVEGQVEVGVVYDPVRDALYEAERGEGAWLGERRLSVTSTSSLGEALVATGFPYDRQHQEPGYLAVVERVLKRVRGIRRLGSSALDLAMVAAGHLDAYWESGLKCWDVAAGVLLVEEAGGKVTALDGTALRLMEPAPLATNGRLHASLQDTLVED